MDLTQVEKDPQKREALIKLQKGDGRFNPQTGVYKWGSEVFDLTKTDGKPLVGWMPIRSKIINYKKQENK